MRRLLAITLATAIACSDGVEPVDMTPLEGSYQLTAIDDHALPYDVTIDDEATAVTAGQLEFGPRNLMTVNLTLGPSGSSVSRLIAIVGFYRRVTADSVVLPAIAPPELFLRRTGTTVILNVQPAGVIFGSRQVLGGALRFTFVEEQ